MCITHCAYVPFSVLCFGELPEYFDLHYESNQQYCFDISDSYPETTKLGNIWLIESVVQLGTNCNYTVHVISGNGAGERSSTGVLTIS